MEDNRNYIDQLKARTLATHGKELSPDEMVAEFAKLDLRERVDTLDDLDRDLAASGSLSLDEAVKLSQYVGKLRRTNDVLRKVGR